ncbi:PAS domain S-box-containing protein [Actinoplanes octamycinicus]|uniref:PAS domain S-box-containing protein n=1 Tax=Actinoplanes octamycinicus TaxID=135948 RepID=A0A7W7M4Y7_9ACTN|nr:PAS domain-containing protein [Actinoplanes octamycinicus]MBB4737130.1 PAS domain S-box-containing protein [Actinoplanes octamycinicus]GIE62051.1 chemotaxis protein [Actinoplanes octamycinicus]
MRATRVRPTGIERTFGDHEMIVTKTDPRGVITYANDVFLRVSALPEAEAVGQPHNLIRHPDMPRAVFKLLWDVLAEQREIFAYVLNLAADGAHYWVLAHVTPSYDAGGRVVGYHSNRRRPSPSAVAAVSDLYASLRAVEARHSHTPDAVAAGYQALQDTLADRGMDYDELVWSLTNGGDR